MKIAGILDNSLSNGKGMRTVIFTSGCSHNCPKCHNKELQDINSGIDMDIEEILERIQKNVGIISGVTISGGDPFYQPQDLLILLKEIKYRFKDLNVWVYTGYTYEELIDNSLLLSSLSLKYIDVLVDGRYVDQLNPNNYSYEEVKNNSELQKPCKYKGSVNQRILRLEEGKIKEELYFE